MACGIMLLTVGQIFVEEVREMLKSILAQVSRHEILLPKVYVLTGTKTETLKPKINKYCGFQRCSQGKGTTCKSPR